MDQGLLTFNLAEGERQKDAGIEQASEALSKARLVAVARQFAFDIAKSRGSVTADDVFQEMEKRSLYPELLGNAAGSIFRGKDFVFSGQWKKSARVSNHARMNRVWILNKEGR